ncbi:MAG TPA: ATP-binding protein, partial [Longimicrobium sp.]|nr:ATP-binding protein [Longimicrobium sp.]
VWNPGMLPAVYINDPDARLVSRPHNPDIARVFNYMGYAETMGIGMWRIRNEMAQAGLPSPTWANHGGGVLLTLPRTGQVRKSQIEASVLPARAVAFLRETNPGEQFTTVQYRDRFAPNVSERSARSDIRALVEQGFLRQEGRGYQTTYVRLPKSAGNG